MLAITLNVLGRNFLIVLALVGDSTITNDLGIFAGPHPYTFISSENFRDFSHFLNLLFSRLRSGPFFSTSHSLKNTI
jgi:hypothetical protein